MTLRKSPGRRMSVAAVTACLLGGAIGVAHAEGVAASAAAPPQGVNQQNMIEQLRRELAAQKAQTELLERRLNAIEASQQNVQARQQTVPQGATIAKDVAPSGTVQPVQIVQAPAGAAGNDGGEAGSSVQFSLGRGEETTPGAPHNVTDADIYSKGFFIKNSADTFAMYFNGLFQPRFTGFQTRGLAAMGKREPAVGNFDVFLSRFAVSGYAFDPSWKYFLQVQASTTGNSNGITLVDSFISKTFSPYATVQMGRYWSPYTYEYYDSIGQYLFPDLSTVEYAFSLGRQVGAQLSGQVGKLTYNLTASNSIPGTDVVNQENMHSNLAFVANLQYDILAPYGYQESDPNPAGTTKPELSLWVSGMYNPVEYTSVFQNERPGDKTYGATSSLNFRYDRLSVQGSGYYRRTDQKGALPNYDSYGYQQQAGYYVVPGQWELTERVGGLWWGKGEIASTNSVETNWFSGPDNFSYRHLTEYSAGLNRYFYGHNVKLQLAYTYLQGLAFTNQDFSANRVMLQSQIMF